MSHTTLATSQPAVMSEGPSCTLQGMVPASSKHPSLGRWAWLVKGRPLIRRFVTPGGPSLVFGRPGRQLRRALQALSGHRVIGFAGQGAVIHPR